MNADDFFGEELTNKIREILRISFQLNDNGRQKIVDTLHEQMEVNDSQAVKEVLNRLAEIIEKNEVSQ